MARVFLTGAIQNVDSDYNSRSFNAQKDLTRLVRAAQTCAFREHTLATDACDADLIIFVGSARTYHEDVRRSAVLRAFRDKCFMFDAADKVIPFLPGVYASIEKRWHWPGWTRSGFYLNVIDNESIGFRTPPAGASLLFSFVGSAGTAAVRRRIMRLDHPNCHLADMQNQGAVYNHQMPERVRLYAERHGEEQIRSLPARRWRVQLETVRNNEDGAGSGYYLGPVGASGWAGLGGLHDSRAREGSGGHTAPAGGPGARSGADGGHRAGAVGAVVLRKIVLPPHRNLVLRTQGPPQASHGRASLASLRAVAAAGPSPMLGGTNRKGPPSKREES